MADNLWLGTASAVAQVDTFTPATVEVNDVFTLTATAEDGSTTAAVSFTATATTVANVCTGLAAAWNASTNALHTPITAADGVTEITLTADTAGVPFYVASTTTDGGGNDTQTLTRAATTANSGPNDWNTAANWSLAAVPVATNAVYFENSAISVTYGLYAAAAIELASLTIAQTYTGTIGTTSAYMQIESALVDIGAYYGTASPAGSGRIRLNLGTLATAITIHNSATTATDTNYAPIRLLCVNAANVINARKGTVSIADDAPGEVSTVATINVSYVSSVSSDANVIIGSGVTLTALTKTGGAVMLGCAATTVTQSGGTLATAGSGAITTLNADGGTVTTNGTGAITTANISGGTVYLNSTGTIGNLVITGSPVISFAQSNAARTVTDASIDGSASITVDPDVVTLTDDISLGNWYDISTS